MFPHQEQARCHITRQTIDYAIWLVSLVPADVLQEYVHDAAGFIKDRKETVICANDQVPVWIYLQADGKLYLNAGKPTKAMINAGLVSDVPLPYAGCTQLRAQQEPGAEKIRLAFDVGNVIKNCFNGGDPTGSITDVSFPSWCQLFTAGYTTSATMVSFCKVRSCR